MFGDFLMIFHAKKWLIIQLQQLEKMNHFTVSLVKLVSWLRISARSCNESNKLESPKPNPRTPKPTLSWMKPTLQGTRKHIPPKRESRKIIFQNCFGKGYVTSQEGKSFFLKKYTTCATTKICERDSWLCFLKSSIHGILTWISRRFGTRCLLEVMEVVKESPSPVGGKHCLEVQDTGCNWLYVGL